MEDNKHVNPLGGQSKETAEAGHKGHSGLARAKDFFGKGKKDAKTKIIKAVVKAMVMLLVKIMIPVIIAGILIAGFYKIIKKEFKDTTTSSYSSAIGGIYGTSSSVDEDGNIIMPSIKIVLGENGRYNAEYDVTEGDINNVWSILNSTYYGDNYSDLTEENIKFIAALVKHGFKLEKYNKKEHLQLLFLFFKAEIASQSLDLRPLDEMYIDGKYNPPSFEEEGIPGIIRVNQYRVNPDNNETIEVHLSYIPENEFEGNMQGHFTINENGNFFADTISAKYNVRPSFYVKYDLEITGGNGSEKEPYVFGGSNEKETKEE